MRVKRLLWDSSKSFAALLPLHLAEDFLVFNADFSGKRKLSEDLISQRPIERVSVEERRFSVNQVNLFERSCPVAEEIFEIAQNNSGLEDDDPTLTSPQRYNSLSEEFEND